MSVQYTGRKEKTPGMPAACKSVLVRWAEYFFIFDPRHVGGPSTHRGYITVILFLLLPPFFFSFNPRAAEPVSILSVELPSMCFTKAIFHVQCPGCGLSRSFILLAHGHFRDSFHFHRLGIPLYLFFILQLFYRLYLLRFGHGPIPLRLVSAQHYISLGVIILLILNWVAGFYLGSNGS